MLLQTILLSTLFHSLSSQLVLTDNFQESISSLEDGQFMFIKFYAPWCGHCKQLAPVWTQLSRFYENEPNPDKIKIAKIDCTQFSSACGAHNVRGYPTLKLYTKDASFDYNDARNIISFRKFISKVQDPAMVKVSKAEGDKFSDVKTGQSDNINFVLYLKEESGQIYDLYSKISQKYFLKDDLSFYLVVDEEIIRNKITINNKGEYFKSIEINESSDPTAIKQAISFNLLPKYLDLTATGWMKNTKEQEIIQNRILILYLGSPNSEIQNSVKQIAFDAKFENFFLFGNTDQRVLDYLGLPERAEGDTVYAHDLKKKKIYNLSKFIEDSSEKFTEDEFLLKFSSALDYFQKGEIVAIVKETDGFVNGIKHTFKNILYSLQDLWEHNPMILILITTLPTLIIGCFIYAVCFLSDTTGDEELYEEKETVENEEKNDDGEQVLMEDKSDEDEKVRRRKI